MPKSRNNTGNASTIDALKILKGRFEHAVDPDSAGEGGVSAAETPILEPPTTDQSAAVDAESSLMGPAVPEESLVSEEVPGGPEMSDWPTQVPLDHIRVGGVNVRQDFDEGRLAELQAAIATMGLLQPLVVAPEPGEPGYWHLIAGERRYRAIQRLQWTEVPVRVVDAPVNQWRLLMMAENVQRENFTLAEELHGYLVMIQEDHRSVADIAQQVQVSTSYIYTMIRAYRNRRVREAIDEGLIPSRRMLIEVSRMITSDGAERVPGIVDRALRFLGDRHPTQSEFRRTIETWLLAIELPQESQTRRRKPKTSLREQERERIQGLIARCMAQGDRDSLMTLREVYQQIVEDLSRIAELDRAVTEPRPSDSPKESL